MPYIYGERIRLRSAEKEDIPTFLQWINDVDVAENLVFAAPWSRVEEERWFDAMMAKPSVEHALVIEIKDQDADQTYRPIGTCQFIDINWRNRSAEVGIMIGEKSVWNQGYGTEAMCLLLAHGFETLNFHRIWLQVLAKNKRGIRAYEKAGFINEGKFRQSEYQHGSYHDVFIMSVLKDEWQADRSKK